ncbi:hypothetical protein DFH08DRAFT_895802 [Mycena albidolilacea]|uniref:CCHC-type domain-containing protein n=1 Tax=Mycena albidolilacea TaxID=1033008 RepID=A0AAD6Z9R6_9AGAR|nr:hypothetical protein DFH08DRAFT_895802 [Mycena albidolilacea]
MSMLSLLRLRAPAALRAPVAAFSRRPLSSLSSTAFRNASLRLTSSGGAAAKRGLINFCPNCRREGHSRKDCKEPTICVACGVEGHMRRDCPNPDPARIEALNTSPKKCFRCGVEGHILAECPQPAKCFHCGSTDHIRKDCPTRPPPTPRTPAPRDAQPEAVPVS